ncbi:MAG: hypothetical protein GC145_11095 [Caulobacter sp.]|nr:hypothetical protein [Caulobacter sp.]
MTKDQLQSVRDDIAFMRALAEEGSQVPLLGGGVTAAAGLIFGVAALVHWMIETGMLKVSQKVAMANWPVAGVLFGVVCFQIIRRASRQPGARSALNRAVGSAWSAVGFAIFATFLATLAMVKVTGSTQVLAIIPVIILALYGSAWSVAADLTGKLWLRIVALGSFGGAVVMGLMAASPYQMLAYAVALLLLALVPGLILLRQEPSDTI